jgi:exosome complex RNA-binding protein Csl4
MINLNFWGKLWPSRDWSLEVERVAARSAEAVLPRIGHAIHGMGSAERYGYIRAHATGVVSRDTAAAINEQAIRGASRQQQFGQQVLQRVIDLVGQRVALLPQPQVVRRAA